jgi:hypothetical protein
MERPATTSIWVDAAMSTSDLITALRENRNRRSPKIVSFETQTVGEILITIALDEDGKLWYSCRLGEFFTEWLPYPSLPKRNAKIKPQVPEQPSFVTGDDKP